MTDAQDWPRIGLTGAIVLFYGYALLVHYDTGLEEALKNILLIAVGFWLGSSKRSPSSDASGKPGDPVNVVAADPAAQP